MMEDLLTGFLYIVCPCKWALTLDGQIIPFFLPINVHQKVRLLILCLGSGGKAQGSPTSSLNLSPLIYQPPIQVLMFTGLFLLNIDNDSFCALSTGSRAHGWEGIQTKIMILLCWNKPVALQGSPMKQEHTSGWMQCERLLQNQLQFYSKPQGVWQTKQMTESKKKWEQQSKKEKERK